MSARLETSILFVEANLTGTTVTAMELARARGFNVVLATSAPEFYAGYPNNPVLVADEYLIIDTYAPEAIAAVARAKSVKGIIAFDDYHLIAAARAAELVGLPAPSSDSLSNARDKLRIRQQLSGGSNPVRHLVLDSENDLPALGAGLAYPVVVKPVDESGSVGVTQLGSDDELRQYIAEHKRRGPNRRQFVSDRRILVEEYIDGPEYSCEALNVAGRWVIAAITKKYVSEPPYFVEKAHACGIDDFLSEAVSGACLQWLLETEASYPAAHIEFRIDRDDIPRLIEINPRLAGGHIADLVKIAHGVDMVAHYLNYHLPSQHKVGIAHDSVRDTVAAAVVYDPPPAALAHLQCSIETSTVTLDGSRGGTDTSLSTSNFDRGGYVVIYGARSDVESDLKKLIEGCGVR